MLGIVRLVKTLVNLLVVLATIGTVPRVRAFEDTTGACRFCPHRTVGLETLGANLLPSKAVESPRRAHATAWCSISIQSAILPGGLVLPGLSPSVTLVWASHTLKAFVLFSSALVRGPPVAI
jgi:hypothetical protein